MSTWPSMACTERRSAPRSSRWLANEWRRVCGETAAPDPRPPRGTPDQPPERLPRQAAARTVEEERCALAPHEPRAHGARVAPHPLERLRARRDEALAIPLPGDDDVARREVHVLDPEAERLGGPEPAGVEQLEQRPIAQPVGPAWCRAPRPAPPRPPPRACAAAGAPAAGCRDARSGRG